MITENRGADDMKEPDAIQERHRPVRAGSNAETTFNNTIVGGFTQVPLAPAEGWIMLARVKPAGTTGSLCSRRTTAPTTSISRCRGQTGTMSAASQVATSLASEVYTTLG